MRYARGLWVSSVISCLVLACAHGERTGLEDDSLQSAPSNQNPLLDAVVGAASDGAPSRDAQRAPGDADSLQDTSMPADASEVSDAVAAIDSGRPGASSADSGRADATVDSGVDASRTDARPPGADAARADAGPVACESAITCATSDVGGQYLIVGDEDGRHIGLRGGYPTFFQLTVSESSGYLIDLGARLQLSSPASANYELRVYPSSPGTCASASLRGANVLSSRVDAAGSQSYMVIVEVRAVSGTCGLGEWTLDIDSEPNEQ